MEAACLLRVLTKPELDSAIILNELVLIMENFGVVDNYEDDDDEDDYMPDEEENDQKPEETKDIKNNDIVSEKAGKDGEEEKKANKDIKG